MQKWKAYDGFEHWIGWPAILAIAAAILVNGPLSAKEQQQTVCPLCPAASSSAVPSVQSCPASNSAAGRVGKIIVIDSATGRPSERIAVCAPCCVPVEQAVWSAVEQFPATLIAEALEFYTQHLAQNNSPVYNTRVVHHPELQLSAYLQETRQTAEKQNQELRKALAGQQKHIQQLTNKLDVLVREIKSLQQQVQTLKQQPGMMPALPYYPYPVPYPHPHTYPPMYQTPRVPIHMMPVPPQAPTTWNGPAPMLTPPPLTAPPTNSARPTSYTPFASPPVTPFAVPVSNGSYPVLPSFPLPYPGGTN